MFAAQIVAPRLTRLVDVEEPSLSGEGQVKIRLERGCLCGSDSPLFDYDLNKVLDEAQRNPEQRMEIPFVDYDGDPYPMLVGQSIHECLGTVVESTSSRFKEGDFVLALPDSHAGLVEYLVAGADRAIHLPKDAVPKEEILMTQPLGTVVWACQKLGNLLDQDIVVAGQGPMGLLFTHMLANLGARTVIALDKLDNRLEAARQMHATHTVNVDRQDPVEAIREITNGKMADICIEVVGHQMATINTCMGFVRRLGTILCFGVPDHANYKSFAYQEFFRQNLSLISSVGPDVVPNFSLARDLIAQGRIDVSPLVTHTIPFSEVQKGYELFVDRKDGAIKVVLDYENPGV
jgi:threonine dehydrogenase-like Zn-dependent dehydrogenase